MLVPNFSFLIYDNSREPEPIPLDVLPASFRVAQSRSNRGIAVAYNEALREAEMRGCTWLLLLDSDTQVTAAFLQACVEAARKWGEDRQVGAAVPHVVEGSLIHSPRFIRGVRRRAVPLVWEGIFPYEIVAPNSGSLVRVSAITGLGGFNEEFWLDYLDYWLFRAMQREGFKVYVLGARVEHFLSFADPTQRMTLKRYQNMLDAEQYFTVRYGKPGEHIRLRMLLLKRAAALCLKRHGGPYVRALMRGALRPSNSAKPPAPPPA